MCADPSDDGQPFDNEYGGTWTLSGDNVSLVEETAIGTTTAIDTWNNDDITLTLRREDLCGDVDYRPCVPPIDRPLAGLGRFEAGLKLKDVPLSPGDPTLKKSAAALLAICLSAVGCSTHRATISSFSDPAFEAVEIERLAVFPIRNARAAPSEARQMNRRISQGVADESPGVILVNPTEVLDLLNDHGLADDWAVFYEGYVVGGVPDAAALRDFGQALNVDAILQGEVVRVVQIDGSWGANKGQTRVTVRFSLLDTSRGRLIWEASSDGIRENSTTIGGAPPIIEAVELAVNTLIENMPRLGSPGAVQQRTDISELPPEPPVGEAAPTDQERRIEEQFGVSDVPARPEADDLISSGRELLTYAGGEVDVVIQRVLRAMTRVGFHATPTRAAHDCYTGFDGVRDVDRVTTIVCEVVDPESEDFRWEIHVFGNALESASEVRRAIDGESGQ